MPTSASNSSRAIEIEGHPEPDSNNLPSVDFRAATPATSPRSAFRFYRAAASPVPTARTPSRWLSCHDSMARKFWPSEDPLGRRVRVRNGPWMTVVGISGDVIHDWFNRRNTPAFYRPFSQSPTDYSCVVVRTTGDPASLAPDASAGAPRCGSRPAGVRGDDDEAGASRADDRPAVPGVSHDRLRRDRPAAGRWSASMP